MSNEIEKTEDVFGNASNFEHGQRVAKMLSSSSLIPKDYQNNIQNTMIALEMANRIGANPLMVMQNLYIVHGRPSWSSTFIVAAINASGKFSPLRYEMSGEGDDYGCTAYALDLTNNDRLDGPKVTWKMVKAEGWDAKNGSKWKTMPELMFRYRAAAFFGRLYAPELLMGILTADETEDISYTTVSSKPLNKVLFTPEHFEKAADASKSVDELRENGFEVYPEVAQEYEQYCLSRGTAQ